jgi:outer membrane protein W
MKAKITLLALMAFCFANAQDTPAVVEAELDSAKDMQFKEGDMFVEGGISFSTQESTSSFSINPKFGYFLSNRLAVGGDLDFANSKEDLNDAEYSAYGIGVFARYYFFETDARRFKVYGDAGLGYSHAKEEFNVVDGGRVDNTTNGIKANVTIGLNYFFTSHLAATFTLADILTYNNANPENGDSSSSFELNINLFNNIFAQPKFGLLYKF